MAIADLGNRLLDVNRSYCHMLGYASEELLGRDFMELAHPADRLLGSGVHRRLTSGEVDQVSYVKRYMYEDGQILYTEVSTAVITGENGEPVSCIASIKDISDERALLAQLSHQALHDPLTGLVNRVLFEDRLSRAEKTTARQDGSNAVFLLDLDNFEAANDTLGHHVGKQLLVEPAASSG